MSPTSIYSIVSRIQNRLQQNVPTDESVSMQLIEDTCHVVRLNLLKKSKDKGSYYQTVCCLPVICQDIVCDGMLLESVKTIKPPKFLTSITPKITNVSKLELETYFYLGRNKSPIKRGRYAKLIRQKQFSLFEDDLIVLYDDNPTEFVCFSAVFDNPYDEAILKCNPEKNTLEDIPYPMDSELVLALEDTVFQMLASRANGANYSNDNKKTMTP